VTERPAPVLLVASVPYGVPSLDGSVVVHSGDIAALAKRVPLVGADRDGETVPVGLITRGTPAADGYHVEVTVHGDRPESAALLGCIGGPFALFVVPVIKRRQLIGAAISNVENWRPAQLRRSLIPPRPDIDLTPLPPALQWWATPTRS
jgi:hypothetical protein